MISTTDLSDVTSGTPAVYYTIDGGAQGTGAGASVHEGNGQWTYTPAQAETNGDHVVFTMVLSGAVSDKVNVWPVSFDPTDSVRMGVTALPNAAADAAGGLPVSDAGGLDLDGRLDAAISSRNATTPPTAAQNRAEMDSNSTKLIAIVEDTNELQTNQGAWATATGFSTHTAADVWTVSTRTLSSFGTLIADIWASVSRTLTAGTKDSEIDAIKAVTDQQAKAVINGTVGSGSTTTNIVSGLTTTTDSLNGKIVTFDKDTTTAALRGQSTDITDTDASGNLTVTALTAAPASGDTYQVT